MSNNSWKQYGGISDLDNFNFINANTIIADQFVSRSTQPTVQIFNGTFIVNNDLSAGVNIYSGNSIYSNVDLFVNRNIYSNNKLYFGGNALVNTGNTMPARAVDSDSAFIYGDISYIGVNIVEPETIFHITGTLSGDTDILTVENKNSYIRNIVSQNVNQRGVVIDGDDTSANIHFYIDNSTNSTNAKDATMKYTAGGVFSTTTSNSILQSSRENQVDTSGGTIFMSAEKYQVDSSGSIIMNSSGGYIIMSNSGGFIMESSGGFFIDTSGTNLEFNVVNGNINIDSSGQFALHCSGGEINIDSEETSIMSDGSFILHSSGGYLHVTSEYMTNFKTLLNVTPFERDLSSNELYNETLTVYDNSNSQFLENVYNDAAIKTGNTMVGIGSDPSSNTFMRLVPATSLQGSAYGGGLYPSDTARSMNVIGVNDLSGNLIVNEMIVESTNKSKFKSTLGINTHQPITEQYVVNMNGPLRLTNGEINTVVKENYEFKSVSFSKTHPLCGIVCGTPISLIENDFNQQILYTKDGGATWNKSDLYLNADLDDFFKDFNTAYMYDNLYGFIAANTAIYYTNSGGENWGKIELRDSTNLNNDDEVRYYMIALVIASGSSSNLRVYLPFYKPEDTATKKMLYFDVSTNVLDTEITTNPPSIPFEDIVQVSSGLSYDISAGFVSTDYLYLAGNGLSRYTISTDTSINITSSSQYYGVDGVSNNFVVAVGNNVISYVEDGTNWTHITLSSTTLGSGLILRDVYVKDASNIVAVGDNGTFVYTTQGPYSEYWKAVPNSILNTNGMADRLTGSENQLRSIDMTDDNTFIISDVITLSSNSTNDSEDILGLSKIQYSYFPYIFNRDNNSVADVCGNIIVSGNIESLDGRLYVGQNSLFQGDVTINSRLFVASNVVIQETTNMEKDTVLSKRLFVTEDVSLNKRLFVNENSIFNDDVSMNTRLDVNGDVSLNNDLTVEGVLNVIGNVNLTKFNSEYITNIETTNYSLIVTEDISLNGRLFIEEDASFNQRLFVNKNSIFNDDVSMNNRLFVTNDVSLNKRLFVNENSIFNDDVSMNNRLFVANDASFSGNVFIDMSLGIGIQNPQVALDVSYSNAIRIPRGNVLERPDTTGGASYHGGYIRYNIENSQFEGYGPGDSWGSLGGVVNVIQNTKITAAHPNADSQNNELLFFTSDTSGGSAVQRMIIQPDGSIGIGTNYAPSYEVDISGNVRITKQCDALSFNATSDFRLKENIQPIYDSLTRVSQLSGVDFNWTNDENKTKHSGLIAQDVEKIIPEVVNTSTIENIEGIGLKSIEYNGIIPYLIESIKTLNNRVTELEEKESTKD